MSPARATGPSGTPVAVSQRRASPLKSVVTIFVPSGLNCTEENVRSGFASKLPVAGLLVGAIGPRATYLVPGALLLAAAAAARRLTSAAAPGSAARQGATGG